MKIIRSTRNFLYNILRLFKLAAESRIVYWDKLVGNVSSDCNIDKQAAVLNTYSLSNVTIGKGTYLANGALVMNTTFGKFCSVGPNLSCGWGIHPLDGISTSPVFYSTKAPIGFTFSSSDKCEEHKQITIGNDVFIGRNVTILDGITIGDGAVIGAGAVVTKDIPPYAIAVGCPIQIVKYRFSPEIIAALLESKWWDREDAVLEEIEKNFFDVEKFLAFLKKG
jgi:Acetyltransferase (isoleucine patch superfamily)